jgi:antitoxin VapB
MAPNIKNDEAERLARELADATGQSITGAITAALRQCLDRVQAKDKVIIAERFARLHELSVEIAARWPEESRDVQHGELLYDEAGWPR